MNFEFMTIDTPLPPCMPFPRALTGFPVGSTAKVMYCRMLDAILSKGQEDENGILFVCFPVTAIAAVLSRSPMTVKRSLNELEAAGLIMRVHENKYHPIRDYLSALVWDGTERIRFCLRHFLGADADDYTYEALKLFLLGAISRAFQPGCKFEIMLCLVGGQGAGKSTFFRLLAVRDEWFSDDLRKLDDDNVYRKLQGHWIIEMSEMMATANAKSIEEIKSFLSRQKEVYKIPYVQQGYFQESPFL